MVDNDNKRPDGRLYGILGIVFAILSFIVLPIVFGLLAVIFGIIAINKKDVKLGTIAIILGIVLAILSVLLTPYFYNLGSKLGGNSFNEESWIKETLSKDYGYEVISASNFSGILLYHNYSSGEVGYLKMKSLGNRDDQIQNALGTLSVAYENAKEYDIEILTPEEMCSYIVDGNVYRSLLDSEDGQKIFLKNGSEIDSTTLGNMVSNEINYSESCS